MIGPDRLSWVSSDAVIPEQIVCYVRAVAGSVPRIFDSCLGHETGDDLVLIGYPLHDPMDREAMSRSVDLALERRTVRRITVLAATRPKQAPTLHTGRSASPRHSQDTPEAQPEGRPEGQDDAYLSLPIPAPEPGQKLRNLLRRAGREVTLEQDRSLSKDHSALVDRYLESRDLSPGTRHIFRCIPGYIQACPGALIVSARLIDNRLAGFVIGDYTSLHTACYMFAFRDPDLAPPGTADLLLHALLEEAENRGQQRMNLGLGINPAIAFFKKKWGATPFLPYVETTWERKPKGLLSRLRQWAKGNTDTGNTG